MVCSVPLVAIAQAPDRESTDAAPYLRPPMECPADLSTLITGLLRDLPSYANRVARRSLGLREDGTGFGTILLAGRAELTPLDIEPLTLGATESPEADVRQAFFTTLERQYTATNLIYLEQYHWLFLAEGPEGWRLVFMFSRLAPDESERRPPTPPAESSDGIIGQAVRLWLRDCRAGAVYPIDSDAVEGIGP